MPKPVTDSSSNGPLLSSAHIHTSLPFSEKEQQRIRWEFNEVQSCKCILVKLFSKAQYFYNYSQKAGRREQGTVQWLQHYKKQALGLE